VPAAASPPPALSESLSVCGININDAVFLDGPQERSMAQHIVRSVIVGSLLALAVSACGTATGTAVGAGAGAAVGAGTGYGAGKGALIGAGVGAAAGAIYDITKHNN